MSIEKIFKRFNSPPTFSSHLRIVNSKGILMSSKKILSFENILDSEIFRFLAGDSKNRL
jgi:hypothetical protein